MWPREVVSVTVGVELVFQDRDVSRISGVTYDVTGDDVTGDDDDAADVGADPAAVVRERHPGSPGILFLKHNGTQTLNPAPGFEPVTAGRT